MDPADQRGFRRTFEDLSVHRRADHRHRKGHRRRAKRGRCTAVQPRQPRHDRLPEGGAVMDSLNRDQAPFPAEIWRMIDEAAASAARDQLTARRYLDLEGPFGVGLTAIEVGNDDYCRQPGPDEAGAVMGRAIPLPMLRKSFQLSIRRVSAYVQNGQPLDLNPAQEAAEAVADREEEMIYSGQPSFGLQGLLSMEGRQEIAGSDWTAPDRALQDVLAATTRLDDSGYRGPYALALAPALYNNLFRLYPGTDVLA